MGAEFLPKPSENDLSGDYQAAPVILGLLPAALVDHIARVDLSILSRIPGEPGGSFPVAAEELKDLLKEVNTHISSSPNDLSPVKTIAGGSVTNTIRGLAAGFGISCGVIGACGDDEQGALFLKNMSFYGVNISRLRVKDEHTGQCVCLVDPLGNRTMRPCIATAAKIQAGELKREDFKGSKWLVVRYSIYNIEVINAAIQIAKQEGLLISLDLASFEMVRKFRTPLLELLESGNIDLCFANEDEAAELLSGEQVVGPEAAVDVLGKYCQWAVVTLGPHGCIARHKKEVVKVPAIGQTKTIDATGAGDLFAGGFLYGLVKGMSLEECCIIGSCSGGSVIRSLGGEVSPENWQWMYKQFKTKGLPAPIVSL
ncbi:unnamed protein product [Lactuca virosa]|uniref:Carbohydrate kinase PfkB domain-containing protein n=1 Tax=Lactuca virosa TaxID=75947 RepID=A0AAU9MWD9_9ASTR|nr:unnamed protein product [Lactuca virosa]